MAQVQITDLPNALPLTGTESVPIVQNGVTVQTTTGAISSQPSQQQTFLTVDQDVSLPNSRYLAVDSGLSLLDGGPESFLKLGMTGAASSLNTAGNGIMVKSGMNTLVPRSIASTSGLSVSNADGTAGNPTISLDGIVGSIENIGSGNGFFALNGITAILRQIYGTPNQIDVLNGNGTSDPIIGIAANPVLPGTEGFVPPSGTTAQRPLTPNPGTVRYNTDLSNIEIYDPVSGWSSLATGAVSLINTGTGLTGGPITSSGTISIANTGVSAATYGSASSVPQFDVNAQGQLTNASDVQISIDASQIGSGQLSVDHGGTGASTLTGYVVGNGTSAFTATSTIPTTDLSGSITNSQLQYDSMTINGTTILLGGSATITAAVSSPLTIGTGLSGTSYDGSAPVTIAIDSSVATLTGIQTLTNKTISGSSNTLSNIGNSSLTNSSVTYNGVAVALGSSGTITAANPNALTIGTGLTGTSYDGASPVTVAIDSTVATLTGIQTLTNKSMSGLTNTFTNIPNSALSNNTISGVALGGNLFPLTIGTGLTGSSYDGSGNVTIAIDSTVATLTGLQTLTNKSISGSTNTLTNIGNSSLTNSSVTIGTTNVALGGTATTLSGLTSITLTQDPVSDLQVATKQYVDSIASGLNYHQPVNYASTTALPAYTYNNGVGGVGATITANANGALSFGGGSPTAGQRLLVKDEAGANQPYNGIYTVTSAGSAGSPFQLTRATDYDSSGSGTNEIDAGDYVLVLSGTNASTAWVQQTPLPITVGTTALVFLQFNAPITYTAGTGLNLSPSTTFNISNTGVTAATYGSGSTVPTIAVNAQGQITSASNTSIAINGNQITSGTVGSAYISGSYTGITGVGTLTAGTWNATAIDPAYGGTGLTSYAVGNMIYATGTTTLAKLPIGTSGQYLSSSGTAPQWSSAAALTKTDDTNVTLTLGGNPSTALLNAASITVGWTGQLSTTRGGTGLSSYTAGDLLYYSTGTSLSRLGIGTANQILTSTGTAPQWSSASSVSIGTATNLAGGTAGAVPYQTGAGATTFLSLGATNYVLTAGATAPQYVAQSTLSVGSATTATTATNANNVAISTSSANADYNLTLVSSNTGNLPEYVATGLTANPSTGKITGGIAGGTF